MKAAAAVLSVAFAAVLLRLGLGEFAYRALVNREDVLWR